MSVKYDVFWKTRKNRVNTSREEIPHILLKVIVKEEHVYIDFTDNLCKFAMHCEELKMADEKPKKLPWGLKPESLAPSSMKVGVNCYLDH